jgi:hypothetical protein
MPFTSRLYVILHPNQSLVVSQLPPREFTLHYQTRSRAQNPPKLIFFELESTFDHPYFGLKEILQEVSSQERTTPKRTKFVSCYRVLEHIDPEAVRQLFIATVDGFILPLQPAPVIKSRSETTEADRLRIFAEICPLGVLALTRLGPWQYGEMITRPPHRKGAPAMFFTQVDMDIDEFRARLKVNPFTPCPFTSIHPARLESAVEEFERQPDKVVKGLCLSSSIDEMSYAHVKHGFWFVSQGKSVFFQMPSAREIEATNFKFWRSM